MVIIGLTGSIGMGKSTAAGMFRRLGVPVHDADCTVRALMRPGGRAYGAIERAFPDVIRPQGIDRRALAARVFQDPEALARLERILHPLVREAEQTFLARMARRRIRIVAIDVPLLFETKGERRVDLVVVMSAPRFLQELRVLRRAGMTRDTLTGILARQMPDALKRRRADFVIPTGLDRGRTRSRIARICRTAAHLPGRCWPRTWHHG